MAGKFIKGALVKFSEAFLLAAPEVIIFQFNPETMTHTWTQQVPNDTRSDPLAIKGSPDETFSFTLSMDANDMIADGSPVAQGLATASGIYSRLAALEMLLYPVNPTVNSLIGSVSAAIDAGKSVGGNGNTNRQIPEAEIATTLFVWGAGRITPVRVTTLTITEKLYDALLNPTHAEAQISLSVLTPEQINAITRTRGKIALTAYDYSLNLRKALALANLANTTEATIGMLP